MQIEMKEYNFYYSTSFAAPTIQNKDRKRWISKRYKKLYFKNNNNQLSGNQGELNIKYFPLRFI